MRYDPREMERSRSRMLARRILLSLSVSIALLAAIELGLRILARTEAVRLLDSRAAAIDPDRVRLLAVGDSNTFGVRVLPEHSYPGRLEAYLNRAAPRYQVVNRGVPGQNTALILSGIEADLEVVRPAIVLVLAGLNNTWNAATGEPSSWFGSLRLSRLLRIARHNLETGARDAGKAPERAAIERARETRSERELREQTRTDLVRLVSIVRAHGARCVLQTYPSHHPHMAPFNEAAREAARATGAVLSDHDARFADYIERYGWDALFFEDSHPAEAGYALMARDLLHDLIRNGLVDAEPLPSDWEPDGFRRPATLALRRDGTGRPRALVLRADPNEEFQIYVSPVREPEVDLGSRRLPIGEHPWVQLSREYAAFCGSLDENGEAVVELPPEIGDLGADQVLYAVFVTEDPRATNERAVRSISNLVEIKGAP